MIYFPINSELPGNIGIIIDLPDKVKTYYKHP